MKKLFYLICVALFTIMFYSCVNDTNSVQRTMTKHSNRRFYIDTIDIHGKQHEIIHGYYGKGGGFIHSPECWCGK